MLIQESRTTAKGNIHQSPLASENYTGKKIIWPPADFVRLPTDKEIISL